MAHWRKNHESDSNSMKSADLFNERASEAQGKDVYYSPVVTIERISANAVKSREKPRGERRNFAHFKGKQKPLGLNVTNCETIESLAGSPNTDRWVGLTIQLYVDPRVRYPSGRYGPAIRIRPTMPDGKPDTGPLPEISEQARERLEEEHEERLAEPADAGDWK